MKTFRSKILVALAVLLSVTWFSCEREPSDAVDQDKIFTEYELFYNQNEDKTYARATFKFSNITGTKLELSDPSVVTFNGEQMTFQGALAYYEREFAGLVDSGGFTWTDLDGNTFTNQVQIHTIDYAAGLDTIDRNQSYELFFTGDPLGDDETVTVTINGENEGDARIFSTNNMGANSIILAQNRLAEIGAGPGTVFMDRTYKPELLDATSAGGFNQGRYRPENASIVLK